MLTKEKLIKKIEQVADDVDTACNSMTYAEDNIKSIHFDKYGSELDNLKAGIEELKDKAFEILEDLQSLKSEIE